MRKGSLFLLCLFSLAFFSQAHLNNDHENTLSSVIQKHYENYLTKLSPEKRAQIQPNDKHTVAKLLSYNCTHDHLVEKMNKKLHNLKGDSTIEEKQDPSKRGASVGPIRFTLIDNLVTSDSDPRACHSSGTTVTLAGCTGSCSHTCKTQDILTTELKNLIESAGEAILEFFEKTLQLPQSGGNLMLNRYIWEQFGEECMDDIPIAESFTTTGAPNTDMLVYLTARPSEEGVVAYALSCNFDYDTKTGKKGRPLAGTVNFVPSQFYDINQGGVDPFEFESAVRVGIHEFTHALGFSSFYYNSYKNSEGNFYGSPLKVECAQGDSPAGSSYDVTITKIITPRVVEVARDHFTCDKLNGVELENYGGAGTSGSHWEKRIIGNEYMGGYVNPLMPVSYITLALFEDMGFYKSNYSQAEYWAWGKDQGCSFVTERCEDGWNKPGYFCSSQTATGCTGDRQGKGTCNVKTFSTALEAYYQHFSNEKIGGYNPASDFCPYIDVVASSDRWCVDTTEAGNSMIKEYIGPDSLCWEYTDLVTSGLGCWKHRCVDGALEVEYDGSFLACPIEGGTVNGGPGDIATATINCPPSSLVCRKPTLPPLGNLNTGSDKKMEEPECGDSKKKESCFIATAAYGSYSEPHVWQLRAFRDNYLAKSSIGRDFISWYYRISPPIANWIAKNEVARFVVRCILNPVTFLIQALF